MRGSNRGMCKSEMRRMLKRKGMWISDLMMVGVTVGFREEGMDLLCEGAWKGEGRSNRRRGNWSGIFVRKGVGFEIQNMVSSCFISMRANI